MSGRKIESELENPIDDCLINLCEPVSEFLNKNFKFITPNFITTVGLIVGLLAVYFVYKENYPLAFTLFWISYYLDCLDGYYARKYNMITKFGDYYDHLRDLLIGASVIILIFIKLDNENLRILFSLVILASLFTFLTHIGCQEKNSNNTKHNDCLEIFKGLCKRSDWIDLTKYFGNGSFILIVSAFIIFLAVKKGNTNL